MRALSIRAEDVDSVYILSGQAAVERFGSKVPLGVMVLVMRPDWQQARERVTPDASRRHLTTG